MLKYFLASLGFGQMPSKIQFQNFFRAISETIGINKIKVIRKWSRFVFNLEFVHSGSTYKFKLCESSFSEIVRHLNLDFE